MIATRDNNAMHAKSGLRVLLEWKINRPDSVIAAVIRLKLNMRLATRKTDFWELRSAEAGHAANPDSFLIPPLEIRQNLQRGQAARLMFDIESENDDGQIIVQGERMWVIVSEKHEDFYVGILDNPPASFEPSDGAYLCFGAEIPFLAEHVIDTDDPQEDYSNWQLSQKPEREWPRD